MTDTSRANQARKAPFEAFGVLYYPLFEDRDMLRDLRLSDGDMAYAMTCAANLEGTGYMLSGEAVLALAATHHVVDDALRGTFLHASEIAKELEIDPLADVKRLVPDVTASPMYPDFPSQVMEIPAAEFRFHQMMHYMSTYGVELLAGLNGLDVTVGQGWMPDVAATEKTERDERSVQPKVLHVVVTKEDMRRIVSARLSRATRMHPAEIETVMLVLGDVAKGDSVSLGKVAFHENMMEILRVASEGDAASFGKALDAFAQHPGDILKAAAHIVEAGGRGHLATRQKKALCASMERFSARQIARNAVDNGKASRKAMGYLSIARFGGPNLAEAHRMVESKEVRSWNSEVESAWAKVGTDGFDRLLALYGERPGVLFRSLTRLVREGCPLDALVHEVEQHADSYSLPTVVRTMAIMGARDTGYHGAAVRGMIDRSKELADAERRLGQAECYETLMPILFHVLMGKLTALDTPLRGKRVFVDEADVSLDGSVLLPNDNGDTGTAWPPVGIAYAVPTDKVVRFFTFWDERRTRVDVDLHFMGRDTQGRDVHVGWNSSFRDHGMVFSGDITSSHDSVEYLDIDMAAARDEGVDFVIQEQHIYCGARSWGDISTCYSGATVVTDRARDVVLTDPANLLFRDDLTGDGNRMDYAVVSVREGWVRIQRGAELPFVYTSFTLGDYLRALLLAQGATRVDDPGDADIRMCVGRSDEQGVLSLFDEGFFVG